MFRNFELGSLDAWAWEWEICKGARFGDYIKRNVFAQRNCRLGYKWNRVIAFLMRVQELGEVKLRIL